MKRLPPAKRNQLIGVIAGTAGLICAVYFLLIHPQGLKNQDLGAKIGSETARLGQYKTAIKQMEVTVSDLTALNQQLGLAEQDVASGDLYAWTYDTMRRFKAPYRVDVPTISQPSAPGDCDLLGDFPYKQIRFTLGGTGYYHDLGKFVSDFENKFPHCRVLNLAAEPASVNASGGERLNFHMDIVALVKPIN